MQKAGRELPPCFAEPDGGSEVMNGTHFRKSNSIRFPRIPFSRHSVPQLSGPLVSIPQLFLGFSVSHTRYKILVLRARPFHLFILCLIQHVPSPISAHRSDLSTQLVRNFDNPQTPAFTVDKLRFSMPGKGRTL